MQDEYRRMGKLVIFIYWICLSLYRIMIVPVIFSQIIIDQNSLICPFQHKHTQQLYKQKSPMYSNNNTLNYRYNHQRLASPSQQVQGSLPFRNHSPAINDHLHGSDQSRHNSTVNLNAPLSTSRVTPNTTEEPKQLWNQHKLFRGFAEDDHLDPEDNGKMKASQFTAITHAQTQLQKSRILEQSRVDFSQLDKAQPARELTNSFISSLQNINFQGVKPIDTYVHVPQESGSSKSGYLLKDNEVDKLIMGALVNYLQKLKSKSEPFYENQTCIKAEDQSFEFKLSFKYEGDNIVFNWESKRNYPHQEYLERKYECFNYFVVDVFPDHIQLFNDFTVQPFVYSKALENHCIRTQLRTFIPLDDPSKAVTVKYTPSEVATSEGSHSRLNANQ